MRLIVVNKTLDRTFNNVSILLRNTIFALQRIGRWCGFSPGVNYSFLFIPKFLLGRDFFFTWTSLAWAGVLWCIRTSKKLDGLKSMRWCGLISFQSPKGRVNSAHKISGFLFFFCSWLSVLRALVPWMALAVMFQGQGGGWSVMYFSLLFFVFFFWYWVFLSIVWYSQGTGVCLFLFSYLFRLSQETGFSGWRPMVARCVFFLLLAQYHYYPDFFYYSAE